ncbi:hypothetical protein OPV22_012795 [Ensete ventricosum]|uniref:Uncharacterized protein n=1 Tax=Ensete ventricosum TaxID=4639 RepID=A0AAV8PLQ1_ENSVE|nr:hypothetical protein OPV22_012795 [Ensete ventricosum]
MRARSATRDEKVAGRNILLVGFAQTNAESAKSRCRSRRRRAVAVVGDPGSIGHEGRGFDHLREIPGT